MFEKATQDMIRILWFELRAFELWKECRIARFSFKSIFIAIKQRERLLLVQIFKSIDCESHFVNVCFEYLFLFKMKDFMIESLSDDTL